jgi:hypothetical protein
LIQLCWIEAARREERFEQGGNAGGVHKLWSVGSGRWPANTAIVMDWYG